MATKKNTTINGKEYFRIRRTIDGVIKNFYGTSKGDAERQYKEYLEELARKKHEKEHIQSTATTVVLWLWLIKRNGELILNQSTRLVGKVIISQSVERCQRILRKEMCMDKLLFKAEVKKQLALRKWSYTDLSEHTTYTPRSVQQIMYDDSRLSDRAVREFSSALNIDVESLEKESNGKCSLHTE